MFDSPVPEPLVQAEPDRTLREIGVAIREGRRQHGLTQMRLEALSGVDQTSISRLERGLAPGMKVSRLARILAVLPRSGLLGAGATRDRDIWLGLPTVIGHR
jgi:transcriptional regulator with XRE-family HTH domain